MPGKKSILIVEDEKPLAHAIELKLGHDGFDTDLAYDGEQALSAIDKGKPDLIILDLVMPNLDGFGVLEALKKKKVKTPVVVLSNLGQPEDEKRVRALGAKDFLVKSSVPLSEILEKIKNLLD